MFENKSIRTQSRFALISFAVSPLLVFGLLVSVMSYNIQNKQALETHNEILDKVVNRVNAYIYNLESELHLISRTHDLLNIDYYNLFSILSKLITNKTKWHNDAYWSAPLKLE